MALKRKDPRGSHILWFQGLPVPIVTGQGALGLGVTKGKLELHQSIQLARPGRL